MEQLALLEFSAPEPETVLEPDAADAAYLRVDAYMRRFHGRSLDGLQITDVPGWWQARRRCRGYGSCRQRVVHQTAEIPGPMRHAFFFAEYGEPRFVDGKAVYDFPRDEHGHFISPYRAWRLLKARADGLI